MKMKTKLLLSLAVAASFVGIMTVGGGNTVAEVPYVTENTQTLFVTHGTYDRLFENVDDMYQAADLVAEVKIKDQEAVIESDPSFVQTRSAAEIKRVLKGNAALKNITITESGGVTDLSGVKGNEKRASEKGKGNQGLVEIAREGSPVMKAGNTYIVFLTDTKDSKWGYTITGSIQGKIRIDNESGLGTVTVDRKTFETEGDKFILQKKFAGISKDKIMASIKK